MHDRRAFLTFASAATATALFGCPKKSSGGKVKVAVSIFPLWDVARRIASDALDVQLVLPPGKTEHAFDPTPKDMQRIAGAKLAVRVGLGLDDWLQKVVSSASSDVTTLELGPKLDALPMGKEAEEEHDDHDHDHDHHHEGGKDPHVWLDPQRMAKAIDPLVDAFAKLDAAARSGFEARGAEVKKSIDALHARIDGRAKAWTKKKIVTFHGSFGYYAARYGLEIAAVIEPFPGKEPTPKYLKSVLSKIEQTKPAALFSEPQLDRKPAQVVADQAKLPLFEIDPIGGNAPLDGYEKLLDGNTDVLEKALK